MLAKPFRICCGDLSSGGRLMFHTAGVTDEAMLFIARERMRKTQVRNGKRKKLQLHPILY